MFVFALCFASASVAASAGSARPSSSRPVDRYAARWSTPASAGAPHGVPAGRPTPPDGPYAGNGDVTVMHAGNASSSAGLLSWQQWLYMSKNDFWGGDAQDYYPHLSAGRVGWLVAPPGAGAAAANVSVAMWPGSATVTHALAGAGGSVVGATRVLENGATTLAWRRTPARRPTDRWCGGARKTCTAR